MIDHESRGEGHGEGGADDPGSVLGDPAKIKQDIRMIERAIRKGWDVPPEMRALILRRLGKIVDKETVDVQGVPSEVHADSNAIAASRAIMVATGQDQADRHFDEKNQRLDEGKPTENIREVRLSFDQEG